MFNSDDAPTRALTTISGVFLVTVDLATWNRRAGYGHLSETHISPVSKTDESLRSIFRS